MTTDQSARKVPNSPNVTSAHGSVCLKEKPKPVAPSPPPSTSTGRVRKAFSPTAMNAPQHEQRAVREVDHAQRAEDERQAQRDQRVGGALLQAVEQLQDERAHLLPPQRRSAARAERRAHPPVRHPCQVNRDCAADATPSRIGNGDCAVFPRCDRCRDRAVRPTRHTALHTARHKAQAYGTGHERGARADESGRPDRRSCRARAPGGCDQQGPLL